MTLNIMIITLYTDVPVEADPSKLRGCIGKMFPEQVLLHHHVGGNRFLFTYPKIQYKILSGTPVIVGINEGAEVLNAISDEIKQLHLGGKTYRVIRTQMSQLNAPFGKCREPVKYRFVTPWLALNPRNYAVYKSMSQWREKKRFLNNILIGNVLSLCKGLDYIVKGKLIVHSLLDGVSVQYKAIPHSGFTGEFTVNFRIPDFLGVGKGASHGFGTVKSVMV